MAAGLALCAALSWSATNAALETDPGALSLAMQRAFDEGAKKGWPFASTLHYETTVFDAGRSFALFKPGDPQYGEVAGTAVQVATDAHYDALLNDDASVWYVREAATWVRDHGTADQAQKASVLLDKIVAGDADPAVLAGQAEDDAKAIAVAFRRDPDSLVQIVVADMRAYNLTHDRQYRSLLLLHASEPAMPLTRVAETELTELFAIVDQALHAGDGFSETDRVEAKLLDQERRTTPSLAAIGRGAAVAKEIRLSHTAPADEYFGKTRLSPLGAGNEILRINKYLDAGWGTRMAQDALYLESSLEDWQHQYPHDPTLPSRLVAFYRLLVRIDDESTRPEAKKMRTLVLVQYAGSLQARELTVSQ